MNSEHQTTIVVTIGRSIGTTPMDTEDWQDFQSLIASAIKSAGGNVVYLPPVCRDEGHSTGRGTWYDQVTEEAAVFVALVSADVVERIRAAITSLAGDFGQEAAGFIVADGVDNLVYPEVPRLYPEALTLDPSAY